MRISIQLSKSKREILQNSVAILTFLQQALQNLQLHNNKIGDNGAQYLAEGLKTNNVSFVLSSSSKAFLTKVSEQ